MSTILQCDQEIQDLLTEVMDLPRERGKQGLIDREFGTKSVGPSKNFKIRVRYKCKDGENLPTVGSIASMRSQPDIRF